MDSTKPSSPAAALPEAERRTLRAIAVFEAAKGLAALAAVAGLLDLMHHDVKRLALELIGRFGLNADARFPSMLLHYAELLPGVDVRMVMLMAAGYIALRWLEAYGLWNDRPWGELLGALSGALYIPFEIQHLVHRPSLAGAVVFAFNVFLVIYLVITLWRRRKVQGAMGPGSRPG